MLFKMQATGSINTPVSQAHVVRQGIDEPLAGDEAFGKRAMLVDPRDIQRRIGAAIAQVGLAARAEFAGSAIFVGVHHHPHSCAQVFDACAHLGDHADRFVAANDADLPFLPAGQDRQVRSADA